MACYRDSFTFFTFTFYKVDDRLYIYVKITFNRSDEGFTGVTRGKRTAPTAALWAFLGLQPLCLKMEDEGQAGINRLNVQSPNIYNVSLLTSWAMMKEPSLLVGTDKMIP
jgi:hypothetical protein